GLLRRRGIADQLERERGTLLVPADLVRLAIAVDGFPVAPPVKHDQLRGAAVARVLTSASSASTRFSSCVRRSSAGGTAMAAAGDGAVPAAAAAENRCR